MGTLLLLFVSNYLIFIAARSTCSTLQGYEEMKQFNQSGVFIANLDPESDMNMGEIDKNDTRQVYDFLNENMKYALYTDGFIVSIPNEYDMEVSFAYLNEEYYSTSKQFELSQGRKLEFDYTLDKDEDIEIPVLIGKGLSKTYPIGSIIKVEDPAIQKQVNYRVSGILKPNVKHSNLYSLNSKQYYNFSVVIPVNKEFINSSNVGLQLQGLFDVIVVQASESSINELKDIISTNLGLKFNFYTQDENFEYYNDFYIGSLKLIGVLTALICIVLTCVAVWSSLASIRLMIKDFTINLFVGLGYNKLRMICYGYYGILSFINVIVLFIITACSRYGTWHRKDAQFSTYGIFGVIGMDWLALLAVVIFDAVIVGIIVEIMMWKIKKVPISLGVLQ